MTLGGDGVEHQLDIPPGVGDEGSESLVSPAIIRPILKAVGVADENVPDETVVQLSSSGVQTSSQVAHPIQSASGSTDSSSELEGYSSRARNSANS
jgi:hypothetical protein